MAKNAKKDYTGKKESQRQKLLRIMCIIFAALMVAGAGSSLIYFFVK